MFSPSDSVRRPLPRRPTVVSILDIGSSKICCLIAKLRPREGSNDDALRGRTHSVEVLGIGHQRSRGIKSGTVVNLDAAEQAIRLAVDAAERMAGVTVDSLIVNVSAGRLQSERYSASIEMSGKAVADADIGRVLAAGRRHLIADGRSVIHALPIGYSLDTDGGIADPRGMVGDKLGVDMHIVTGDGQTLHNLELCINRCHLSIEALVATPYASGLSVLVDDEAELGCACIDFGGGTTTIGVFARGQLVHVDAIAVGGLHITTDIARGLSTRIEEAERLKTMHGSALPSMSDDRDLLSVTPIGDDADIPNQVPRSALTRIIKARIEEILELVRDRLNASGYATLVGRRMVLTGGASQLTGLAEAARRVLARNIRLGRPLGVSGMPEVAKGPAFAAAAGLLIYPQYSGMEQFDTRGEPRLLMTGTGGYFSRVGRWIRESF
jgi:cell division protein FtsA